MYLPNQWKVEPKFQPTIIVKSVGKVPNFTSFFPSFPCLCPNVEQNINVCARNNVIVSAAYKQFSSLVERGKMRCENPQRPLGSYN